MDRLTVNICLVHNDVESVPGSCFTGAERGEPCELEVGYLIPKSAVRESGPSLVDCVKCVVEAEHAVPSECDGTVWVAWGSEVEWEEAADEAVYFVS